MTAMELYDVEVLMGNSAAGLRNKADVCGCVCMYVGAFGVLLRWSPSKEL